MYEGSQGRDSLPAKDTGTHECGGEGGGRVRSRVRLAVWLLGAVFLLAGCGKAPAFVYHFKTGQAYSYHISSDEKITLDLGGGDVRRLTSHYEKDYQMTVQEIKNGEVNIKVDVRHIHEKSHGETGPSGTVERDHPDLSLRFVLSSQSGRVIRYELLKTAQTPSEPVEVLAGRYTPSNYLPVVPATAPKVGENWDWESEGMALPTGQRVTAMQQNKAIYESVGKVGDLDVARFTISTTQGEGAAQSSWQVQSVLESASGLPVEATDTATLHYAQNITLGKQVAAAQVTHELSEHLQRAAAGK